MDRTLSGGGVCSLDVDTAVFSGWRENVVKGLLLQEITKTAKQRKGVIIMRTMDFFLNDSLESLGYLLVMT
jgi:hypothetical protein